MTDTTTQHTLTREEAQAVLFDAVDLGIVEYTPPLYSMGAGLFTYHDDSCRTNGVLVIPMAYRVLGWTEEAQP